jgi:hypothetical protein
MKKLLAVLIMALMVFGLTSAFAEPQGECGAGATAGLPADVLCRDSGGPGTADDRDCVVWFAAAPDPAVGDCVIAPAAP